jgi:hypothetical protein
VHTERATALAVTILLFAGCTAKRQDGDLTVSELFARASEFNGKRVAVVGYYEHAMEHSVLAHSANADERVSACQHVKNNDLFRCDIWVDPAWRRMGRLAGRYVRVIGTFHYRPDAVRETEVRDGEEVLLGVFTEGFGHFGMYPAELTAVTSFRPLRR